MAIRKQLDVKESFEELYSLKKKVKNHRLKVRVLFLILEKERRFKIREELAEYLGVDDSTLLRWGISYHKNGISGFIKLSVGGNKKSLIPSNVHDGLKLKTHDSSNPLQGYWDAINWVKEEYNIELKYNTLRMYMIRNFSTKLKMPRKSHYKKDDQAIEVFKKPS